jgi:hypothetical protein
LSRLRRPAKPLIVLVALVVAALVFSACALYKLGSLQLTQPGGIGSVRVHFVICTEPEGEPPVCEPNDSEGQLQSIVGIAVPKGAVAPGTITAAPLKGGPPIVFTRSDQAAQALVAGTPSSGEPWPPAGTEGIGYLSAPFSEEKGPVREWSFDADFGLPAVAGGSPFGGPFVTLIAYGIRGAGGEAGSPDRPVDCATSPEDVTEESAFCETVEGATLGTSDLKLAAPAQGSVYLGGQAPLAFMANFASTAGALPAFGLSATSTLPGAKLQLPSPTFVPGAPNPSTHLSPPATQTVTVTAPKNAKPGIYDVTLTATTAQGASVSQVAKLEVVKAKIRLGGVKLNKAKGTATLSVKVPGAGTLTASGKGVVKSKKSAKSLTKPKTLKLTIKPKGKAKKLLAEEGTAKVGVKVTFKPLSGAPVTKSKKITLKQN